MWWLLSVLTFCGMPSLLADVCSGLPASPSKDSDMWRPYEAPSFRLSVKPGGSAFRITVRPLWQIKDRRLRRRRRRVLLTSREPHSSGF
jgi:hypothetical protein